MTAHDTSLALAQARHDADLEVRQTEDRDLDREEDELVEDLWDEYDAAFDRADAAWADRGWVE